MNSKVGAPRSFLVGITALLAMVLGMGSLPAAPAGQSGPATALLPGTASAYQAGFSSDRGWHFWLKASRAEVARGVVAYVCTRYMRGPLARFSRYCTAFSATAQRIVGYRHGFWLEVWPWTYSYGTY